MEYKGYTIQGDGTFGYKHIKPTGKGSVNKELRGAYTNSKFAMQAIDSFLNRKPSKKGETEDVKND